MVSQTRHFSTLTTLIFYIFTICSMTACTVLPANQVEQAEAALKIFFTLLNQGEYQQASEYYGGSYETLSAWNPEIDPGDFSALWENGCTLNGLQCLPVRSADRKEQTENQFVFSVAFSKPDGGLFILGPCCRADDTGEPPVTRFDITVKRLPGGVFKVLSLPVYVP